MATLLPDRGLTNAAGQNNCFLNVVIQSLWHLDSFRKRFQALAEVPPSVPGSEVFNALKLVFTQYEYSEATHLPPDALRVALSHAYADQDKFQIGKIDDAAEVHEALLRLVHRVMGRCGDDDACTPVCISHEVFGFHILEQAQCACGATSEAFPYSMFILNANATELREHAREMQQMGKDVSTGRCLRLIMDAIDAPCPDGGKCPHRAPISRSLMALPDVFSIGLGWDSDRQSREDIVSVLDSISLTINASDLFRTTMDRTYVLRGMIMFYGKHYNVYFYNPQIQMWLVFDDAQVIQAGMSWDDVRARCQAGHLQPFVLFYEDINLHPRPLLVHKSAPPAYAAAAGMPSTNPALVASPTRTVAPPPAASPLPAMPVLAPYVPGVTTYSTTTYSSPAPASTPMPPLVTGVPVHSAPAPAAGSGYGQYPGQFARPSTREETMMFAGMGDSLAGPGMMPTTRAAPPPVSVSRPPPPSYDVAASPYYGPGTTPTSVSHMGSLRRRPSPRAGGPTSNSEYGAYFVRAPDLDGQPRGPPPGFSEPHR